jgi:hypothetical protein
LWSTLLENRTIVMRLSLALAAFLLVERSSAFVVAPSQNGRNVALFESSEVKMDEEGPEYDGTGGMGLAKGTANTYIIPGMDEMSPEEYRAALQKSVSDRQANRHKNGVTGNRATWDYLQHLSGESGVLKKEVYEKKEGSALGSNRVTEAKEADRPSGVGSAAPPAAKPIAAAPPAAPAVAEDALQQMLLTLEKRVRDGPGSVSLSEIEDLQARSSRVMVDMKAEETDRLNGVGSAAPPPTPEVVKMDEEGPEYDGTGGMGLAKGTANTYIIPGMDEMSPEEYRAALQKSVSDRQANRHKNGVTGNRATWDYLQYLSGESGVLKKEEYDKKEE